MPTVALLLALMAQVDLPMTPATQFGSVNDIVEVELRAEAATPQSIAAIDAILSWNPAQLELIDTQPGDVSWFVDGFLPDPDGINNDISDGDALYTALAPVATPVVVPPDVAVVRFRFRILGEGDVTLVPSMGAFGKTRVISSTPGVEITGTLSDGVCIGIPGTWTDLGNGLAGSEGIPLLVGTGELSCETLTTFTLTNAPPGAPAYFILGISTLNLPFKGGLIIPSLDIIAGLVVPIDGEIVFGFPWPTGLPSGASLYYQYWFKDPGGVFGFAASNGLQSTTG